MNKVEIFSSDTCKYCVELKDYLKENNVEYIEYNISKDEEARRNLIKLGYMSVPVTLINGNHVLGFDKLRIRQLLNGKE
jgi:glutaredoxin-like YruB-family protein